MACAKWGREEDTTRQCIFKTKFGREWGRRQSSCTSRIKECHLLVLRMFQLRIASAIITAFRVFRVRSHELSLNSSRRTHNSRLRRNLVSTPKHVWRSPSVCSGIIRPAMRRPNNQIGRSRNSVDLSTLDDVVSGRRLRRSVSVHR